MKDNNLQRITTEKISGFKDEAALFGIKDEDKIEMFESKLSESLRFSDSISDAVQKMVKAALSAEFGDKLFQNSKAQNMVRAISQSIVSDSELRKQALLIIDRFAKADELNA